MRLAHQSGGLQVARYALADWAPPEIPPPPCQYLLHRTSMLRWDAGVKGEGELVPARAGPKRCLDMFGAWQSAVARGEPAYHGMTGVVFWEWGQWTRWRSPMTKPWC